MDKDSLIQNIYVSLYSGCFSLHISASYVRSLLICRQYLVDEMSSCLMCSLVTLSSRIILNISGHESLGLIGFNSKPSSHCGLYC